MTQSSGFVILLLILGLLPTSFGCRSRMPLPKPGVPASPMVGSIEFRNQSGGLIEIQRITFDNGEFDHPLGFLADGKFKGYTLHASKESAALPKSIEVMWKSETGQVEKNRVDVPAVTLGHEVKLLITLSKEAGVSVDCKEY